MSATDRFATFRINIANAFSSFFSFSFSFSSPRNGRIELEEQAVPKTPPPKWWQRMTQMARHGASPRRVSPYLMKLSHTPQSSRDSARDQADLQEYTPKGAKYATQMEVFEDVFQVPTVPHLQNLPAPTYHLGRPPPAPDSWREYTSSQRPPPPVPTIEKQKATVVAQKRKRAEAPVRDKRGRGNRRGENGEPARKKARQ